MSDPFDLIDQAGAHRTVMLRDPESGLKAIIAIDDTTLGPAFGGIRTRAYASFDDALRDVQKLAAAMTLKTAIAGLPAGGAKTVVIDHPAMDRAAAFRRLGAYIEDFNGMYWAAGDLGTTADDLDQAATRCRFINSGSTELGSATARGVVECIRAVAETRGGGSLSGLKVAIQGAGLIGLSVGRILQREGARMVVADVDRAAAARLADETGATVIPTDQILGADVDVVAPCATGGVLTGAAIAALRAWGVCGGANNQLADDGGAAELAGRGILFIPDFLSSAGGVIAGVAESLLDGIDPTPLIRGLGDTARDLLHRAAASGRTTVDEARAVARQRIAAARSTRTGAA